MGQKGNSGEKISNNKIPWITLEDDEKKNISSYYKNYLNEQKQFSFDKFIFDSFLNLSDNIKTNLISYLNSYYTEKKYDSLIKDNNLKIFDVISLSNILIKTNANFDDSIYFRKNTLLILYDILKGKILSYEEDQNSMDLKLLVDIFNFTTIIYFNKFKKKSSKKKKEHPYKEILKEDFNNEMTDFIKSNINPKEEKDNPITLQNLQEFIDNKLYALDGFLKTYFKTTFLNKSNDEFYNSINPFPLFSEAPSTLPIYQFFFFCLSNTNISNKPYAFKLYDCKTQGYNLSDLIYSFIGFTGPVIILISHYNEDGDSIILGMYLNSDFKECFEKFCGDDLSMIFSIEPKMNFYKCIGDKDNILFISSKNQKFSKTKPGIGMGFRRGEIRFWLDSNELFSQSYFNQYDDVFEEGTPFKEMKEKLNIGNIEVFGFGNEDDLQTLERKQQRDKQLCDKMKKVDKFAFANSDFDKEMFFSKGYAHRAQMEARQGS